MRPPLMLLACAVFSGGLVHGIAQDLTHKPISQDLTHTPISVVEDWSTHQVVFSENVPRELWPTVLADSRFWQQYYRRHANDWPCPEPEWDERETICSRDPRHGRGLQPLLEPEERDWSVSLGGGSGGTISGPAKFTYDVTATPNCTTDYVVTGINAAGSSTQANIIGLNNLYTNAAGTGYCSGKTSPTVFFAYNVGTGSVSSSAVVSLDGTKIAFIENISSTSSKLHILKVNTATTNGTSATAPVTPGSGVDTQVVFTAASSTAPFVDYDDDVAYVTTNTSTPSVMHKITGVFRGTPTEVTTAGWPATITSGSGSANIGSPVFDYTSKHIFVLDTNGNIDYVDDSVSPAVVHSPGISIAASGTNSNPIIVDSSLEYVYAVSNTNGTNAVVAQANTSLATASKVVVSIGTNATVYVLNGAFNNSYYAGTIPSAARLYLVGNDSSSAQVPALYSIGFGTGFTMASGTPANGPLALSTTTSKGVWGSPLTEFYNTTTSTDYLFVGVTNACSTSITGGCIRSLNITSAFPTTSNVNSVILAATGGTGRVTVDNNASSTTYPQAASVYYTPLSGNTIVKATQAGLQ
jgi:hypothetical protein